MFVVKHVFIISCGLITQYLFCHVMLLLHSYPFPPPPLPPHSPPSSCVYRWHWPVTTWEVLMSS